MNRTTFNLIIACLLMMIFGFNSSCTKHLQALTPQLTDYAREAREPGLQSFVTYKNSGDTIKGTSLKWHGNPFDLNIKWTMNGNEIPSQKMASVQDDYSFRICSQTGYYVRIVRGKMNLYMWQQISDRKISMLYDSVSRNYITHGGRYDPTYYYLGWDKTIEFATVNTLKKRMKDCPSALNVIENEFKDKSYGKHPDEKINDYRPLIRVINVFNACAE